MEWESELDDAKEYVRKLNVISTNKDKEVENEPEKEEYDVSDCDDLQNLRYFIFAFRLFQDKFSTNQKWNLCEALLRVGDWSTAQILIDKLPRQSVIVKEPVAKALATLIHRIIDPVYVKFSGKKTRPALPYENRLTTPQVCPSL